MQKSTFRVRIFEASRPLIALFAHHSRHLNTRQRQSLLILGGAQ
ncbi:hypothetical protein SODG_005915 [Sodalis praecaptivus]